MEYKDINREYILEALKDNKYYFSTSYQLNILMYYANSINGFNDSTKMLELLNKINARKYNVLQGVYIDKVFTEIIEKAIIYCSQKFNIFALLDSEKKLLFYY